MGSEDSGRVKEGDVEKLIWGRHTPAMVIAVLALVAAVGGAAVASPTASTSKLTKKDKKQVRSIADSEIAKLAPGLTVKSASSATTATTANNLAMRAHVLVNDGANTVAIADNVGIGGVTRVFEGGFCLTGLAATPRGGVAEIDYDNSFFETTQIGFTDPASFGCPAGSGAYVFTFDTSGQSGDDAGFYVTLWS
jgi:hypothetical protein